jgi:hypothetical protein
MVTLPVEAQSMAAHPASEPAPAFTAGLSALFMDHRVLTFRPALLCAAFEACGREQVHAPAAAVSDAEPLPDRQAVRFRFGLEEHAPELLLGVADLSVLLLAYCVGARVPLPLRSHKNISVVKGGVVIDFLTTMNRLPRFAQKRAAEPVVA